MTYQNFLDRLPGELSPILPEGSIAEIDSVSKNNGVVLQAVIIREPNSNIFPTIYLEEFYDKFLISGDFSTVCRDILNVYNQYRISENVDVSFFEDFNRVRTHIAYKLVNREKNSALLGEIPWRPFLDLAIVYYIWIDSGKDTHGSILLKNEHMKRWNTTETDLYRISQENTSRILGHSITSLPDFLNEMVGEVVTTGQDPSEFLYVLTNKSRTYGAACILYDNILQEFSGRFNKDVFILPSSVHEVMLLADDGHTDIRELTNLVSDVNQSQVEPMEILSSHAYLYLKDEGRIVY